MSRERQIKAVITDLDGTVLLPDMSVSKRVQDVIARLQANSIKTAPVTGRDFHGIKNYLEPLRFHDFGVFSGGATLVDFKKNSVVWEQRISRSVTRSVVESLLPYSSFIGFGKGRMPVGEISLDDVGSGSYGVWAEIEREHSEDALKSLSLIADVQSHLNHGPREGLFGVHVTHHEVDKYSGSLRLLAMLGISPNETLAIGDGDNDLPLFACAAIKVAMGNASDHLKAEADYVVGSFLDDGFVDAMDRYVL